MYPYMQHEKLSQKVFKEMIYKKQLQKEFEKYGITKGDIDFIAELIHYEPYKEEKISDKNKVFLYQVCNIILCACIAVLFMHSMRMYYSMN